MPQKFLITIVGPTAIGKTSVAIKLANIFRTEIISADSRQFFREMSIGTAKPTYEELKEAKHHFVDNLSITDYYSTGDFEREVISFLDEYYLENDVAILCGGSGLYINAVLNGIDEFPEIDSRYRDEVISLYENEGIVALQQKLETLDPIHYNKMDVNNPQRLMRALEICMGTGKPYSAFLSSPKVARSFTPIKIGLELDREIIYDRINQRVDLMMNTGLLEEVKQLYNYRELNSLQTVGYKELFDYIDGLHDLDVAIDLIKRNTRRYAKKQLTWFKKDKETVWFSPDNLEGILEYINRFYEK